MSWILPFAQKVYDELTAGWEDVKIGASIGLSDIIGRKIVRYGFDGSLVEEQDVIFQYASARVCGNHALLLGGIPIGYPSATTYELSNIVHICSEKMHQDPKNAILAYVQEHEGNIFLTQDSLLIQAQGAIYARNYGFGVSPIVQAYKLPASAKNAKLYPEKELEQLLRSAADSGAILNDGGAESAKTVIRDCRRHIYKNKPSLVA